MTGVPTALSSVPALLAHAAPAATPAPAAGAGTALEPILPAVLVLLLCAVAACATVLLLPGRREGAIRKVGGALIVVAALIFFGLLFRAAAGNPLDQGAHLYFWPFAAVSLVGAVRVITHPRPVYSALYFVLTTFATAGLFVLLWAEFMAAALILIYAGAILVTYVFVIMLAQQSSSPDKAATAVNEFDTVSREPVVAATVGFALMAMLIFVITDKASAIRQVPETGAAAAYNADHQYTQAIGRHLFQSHLVNLELAGLILTLATVGAIVIARRRVVGAVAVAPETLSTPATPIDDNPHSIPVYGTDNPRQKAYPET
ncbi:MAG TPA: NADH-quinone oxidoreductase subunit J [Humisphaera sp.]